MLFIINVHCFRSAWVIPRWLAVLVSRLAFFWSTFAQFCRTAQFLISRTVTGRWEVLGKSKRASRQWGWRPVSLEDIVSFTSSKNMSEWVGGRGVVLDPSLGPKHIASFCNSPLTHPPPPRVQAWRIRSIGWLDIFPSGWHEKDPIRRGCPKFWIIGTLADRWLSVHRERRIQRLWDAYENMCFTFFHLYTERNWVPFT